MTARQEECEYSKYENEEVMGGEQVYECENDDKPQIDSHLNPYGCAMFNDFELYNIHAESAEIEKWSLPNTKVYYVEYKRKELPSNRIKFSPT